VIQSTARVGDPNSDSYTVALDNDGVVTFAIADGSNIGEASRDASFVATEVFVSQARKLIRKESTVDGIGRVLLKSLQMAHEGVVSRNNEDAGSTTLLGGVVVQLATPLARRTSASPINPPRAQTAPISELITTHSLSAVDSLKQHHAVLGKSNSSIDVKTTSAPPFIPPLPTPPTELPTLNPTSSSPSSSSSTDVHHYAIIGISVGDCRAYLYSTRLQKAIDITQGNSHNLGRRSMQTHLSDVKTLESSQQVRH